MVEGRQIKEMWDPGMKKRAGCLKRKFSITRQRKVIVEEVDRDNHHPTVDEIYINVRLRLPKISLGTVYRNLEQMADMKVLKKLEFKDQSRRYEMKKDDHYHLICTKCSRIDDVRFEMIAKTILIELSRESMGYEVFEHRVDIYGLCSGCR